MRTPRTPRSKQRPPERTGATVLGSLTVNAMSPTLQGRSSPAFCWLADLVSEGSYAAIRDDLAHGTAVAPGFGHAVKRHRLLDAITRSAATGRRVRVNRTGPS